MIDVYAIGATLKLNDLVTPQLLKLSEQFAKVDALALQVNKRLQKMGAEVVGVRNLAAAAGKLDTGLKGVRDQALLAEKALGGIRGAVPAGGLGIEKELVAANVEAARLEARLAAMRGLGRSPGGALPSPGGGGGGAGGRGGGGRHGGRMHGGNLHAGPGGIGIGGVGLGLMDEALLPIGAGMVGYYAGKQFYEGAKDYQDATMRFKALGLGDTVNDEADKFARATKAYGVSQTELMSAMAESAGLFNSFDEVKQFTPQIVTLGKANAAIYGDKLGGLDDEGIKSLMKFIDRRGGTKDAASFARNLNLVERLVTGSGGLLKFQDLGTFSQNGGTAFRGLSDEGLMHMEGLMIEQGGQKAGTAMMSLYQNLVAGRTPKKTMGLLQDLGLATLQEQTHGSVDGKPMKSLVMTDIQDSGLLQSDPAKWMTDVLLPALAKKGITSQDDILKSVNDVLSNRNASNQGSIMTTQQFQVLRDYKLAQGAMGSDQVVGMWEKSAAGSEADFAAAWEDFKKQFGTTMLPQITAMLKTGADMLRTLADVTNSAGFKDFMDFSAKAGKLFAWPYRLMSSDANAAPPAGNSHVSASVSFKNAGDTDPKNFNLFLTASGRQAIASSTTSFQADHLNRSLGTGLIDNNVALPMPSVK
jgi:hypothetical protein